MFDLDLYIESRQLYVTQAPGGIDLAWRLLTLKELSAFIKLKAAGALSLNEIYYEVFRRVYMGNVDYLPEDLFFGIVRGVGELCLGLSGEYTQDNVKQDIIHARNLHEHASVDEHMKRVCVVAFGYKPEDIENWNRPELISKFVLGESLLKHKFGTEPLNVEGIYTAKELQEKQERERKDRAKKDAYMKKAPERIDFSKPAGRESINFEEENRRMAGAMG